VNKIPKKTLLIRRNAAADDHAHLQQPLKFFEKKKAYAAKSATESEAFVHEIQPLCQQPIT